MGNLDDLLNRLDGVRRFGSTWRAKCPSHSDKTPSLVIRVDNKGNLLLHCFAGCRVPDVMGALGLPMHALFASRRDRKPLPPPRVDYRRRTIQLRLTLWVVSGLLKEHSTVELRDAAMDIACDYYDAVERYEKERKGSEPPPSCWWLCSFDCNLKYGHEKDCGGCNKTAVSEYGFCREHHATYCKPFRGRN